MNRIWDQIRTNPFWPAFFVMWLILGVLVASALKAQETIRTNELPGSRFPEIARAYLTEKKTVENLEQEIRDQRNKVTELENALATGTKQTKVLNDSLQDAKLMSGLVEVEGPGVEVILQDSKQHAQETGPGATAVLDASVIHDYDVLRVVNELKAAGAEAITVNGQRIVANTAIRCVGPGPHINHIKCASPFVIHAIGDPSTLMGALKMPGGVLADIEATDPEMVSVTAKENIRVPAFAGNTRFRYARPVPMDQNKEAVSNQ